jgi:hypothetical protein
VVSKDENGKSPMVLDEYHCHEPKVDELRPNHQQLQFGNLHYCTILYTTTKVSNNHGFWAWFLTDLKGTAFANFLLRSKT